MLSPMNEPLVVNGSLTIPASDLSWEATRSSGPGGQNVNKVARKIWLRFDLPATLVLDAPTKERLRQLVQGGGGQLDAEGRVLIGSQLTRDQTRNLLDAREKLRSLILRALIRPTPRRPTKPTRSSRERRLTGKREQSERKQQRKGPRDW
jgi:ribosome-associated protein